MRKNKKYTCTFPTEFKYRIVQKNWKIKKGDLANYRHPAIDIHDHWTETISEVGKHLIDSCWNQQINGKLYWVVIRPIK